MVRCTEKYHRELSLPGASLCLDGVRGIDVSWVHRNLLGIRDELIFNHLSVDSDGSADLFDHLRSCLHFIEPVVHWLCEGPDAAHTRSSWPSTGRGGGISNLWSGE